MIDCALRIFIHLAIIFVTRLCKVDRQTNDNDGYTTTNNTYYN